MLLRSAKKIRSQVVLEQARMLRTEGYSYGDISLKLKIAKSTLHTWLSGIKVSDRSIRFDRLAHLKKIRLLAGDKHRKLRNERLTSISDRTKNEVDNYQLKDINTAKSMLSMLYWAEGAKSRGCVNFANTSPELSLLFITLLRRCYAIDESKLRIRLHLHNYHPIAETRNYWSDLLNIPVSQFGKIYIKKRINSGKRSRKNFYGICFIRYHSEDLRYEILEIGRHIYLKLCAHSSIG